MDVETALREIDEAEHKHVGSEDYDERHAEYEDTFAEVERLGGGDAVADLTRWVDEYVREEGSLPAVGVVDKHAARILEDHGVEIPLDSHLEPA